MSICLLSFALQLMSRPLPCPPLNAELNVFEGFFNSPLFTAVMAFTLFMQIVIVQYGGEWVGCVPLSCMLLCYGTYRVYSAYGRWIE